MNIKKSILILLSLSLTSLFYSYRIKSSEKTYELSKSSYTNKSPILENENNNKTTLKILTFANLKKILFENNQDLIKYKNQISQSELQLKSKFASWSPRLNLSSEDLPSFSTGDSYNKLSEDTSTNQSKVGLTGSIEWDVIKPSRRLEIKIAEDTLENTKYNYEFYKKKLYLDTVKKYFQIQASMQDIKISKKAIEISNVSLKEAENRFRTGIGNKLELLEAKTQLGREQILLKKRIGQLNSNKNDLSKILNLQQNFIVKENDNPQIIGFWELNSEESLKKALNLRNDLKIKEKNISINQKRAQSIISEKKPTLSLYNKYSLSNSYGESGVANPDYSNKIKSNNNKVGLKFDLNLFDGGAVKQNYLSLRNKEKELIAELNKNKLEIENDIKNALININIAKSNIVVSFEQVESANESLSISLKRLEAGLTTQREIVNLQGDVSEAESNFISAIKNYNENLFTLVRVVGIDDFDFCDFTENIYESDQSSFVKFVKEKNLLVCDSFT